jgi:hypothetical protein
MREHGALAAELSPEGAALNATWRLRFWFRVGVSSDVEPKTSEELAIKTTRRGGSNTTTDADAAITPRWRFEIHPRRTKNVE